MEKINVYNPKLPYLIIYRNGGWAFYNREYKNLLSGIKDYVDETPHTFSIPMEVVKKINADQNPISEIHDGLSVFLHDNPKMVGEEKRKYISRIITLLKNGIDPLNLMSDVNISLSIQTNNKEIYKQIEEKLIEISSECITDPGKK